MSTRIRTDPTPQRRLALAFVAALGVHMLMFSLIKLPATSVMPPDSSTALQWVDLSALKSRPERDAQSVKPARLETRRDNDVPRHRENKTAVGQAPDVPPSPTLAPLATTQTTTSAPVIPDPEALMASARLVAREMARDRGDRSVTQADNPVDRPFLPKLARALDKPRSSVQRYEGGLIKIITTGGRIYCVQEPPDFARGGPLDPLSVPTNCP